MGIFPIQKKSRRKEGSIVIEVKNLTKRFRKKTAVDGTVAARLPEAYQWLLVPTQSTQ